MLKIGITVCAHGNGKSVSRLRAAYEREHVDAIAVCGDLGDDFKEISSVLKAVSAARVPVIAFPGSHEPAADYFKALKQHKRVIDGTKTRRITIKGYDIVTLPGSSVNVPSATFRIVGDAREAKRFAQHGYRTFLISDLAKFIRKPAKTVILCHDPPRGSSKDGIDVAYSGIVKKFFIVKPKDAGIFGKNAHPFTRIHDQGSIVPEPYASKLAAKGYPVAVKHRNVGNDALKAFLKQKRINFFACGHIHEAGHRAVSAAGRPLKQGARSPSVWYNAAPAVEGNGGILIIDDKATFKNIRS